VGHLPKFRRINPKVLESVNNNPYLGVELSSTLSWDTHIGKILTKANTSGGLFCGRLAGVMFCAFLGVLEVPVLEGLMLLSQDLLNIRVCIQDQPHSPQKPVKSHECF
jgi:hypothetical protein